VIIGTCQSCHTYTNNTCTAAITTSDPPKKQSPFLSSLLSQHWQPFSAGTTGQVLDTVTRASQYFISLKPLLIWQTDTNLNKKLPGTLLKPVPKAGCAGQTCGTRAAFLTPLVLTYIHTHTHTHTHGHVRHRVLVKAS